jgi:hypothetical protein
MLYGEGIGVLVILAKMGAQQAKLETVWVIYRSLHISLLEILLVLFLSLLS